MVQDAPAQPRDHRAINRSGHVRVRCPLHPARAYGIQGTHRVPATDPPRSTAGSAARVGGRFPCLAGRDQFICRQHQPECPKITHVAKAWSQSLHGNFKLILHGCEVQAPRWATQNHLITVTPTVPESQGSQPVSGGPRAARGHAKRRMTRLPTPQTLRCPPFQHCTDGETEDREGKIKP